MQLIEGCISIIVIYGFACMNTGILGNWSILGVYGA